MRRTRNIIGSVFCYNLTMRMQGWAAAFPLVLVFTLASFGQESLPPQTDVRTFLSGLKEAFESSDRAAYLAYFEAEIRDAEGAAYDSLRQASRMTQAVFFPATNVFEDKEGVPLFVQAVFQNDLEALFESWELELARDGERRVIRAKSVIGNPAIFLKLKIPSDRIERAARIEIRHDDLEATFENAWVFYDNIPDRPTGLIIIGSGRLRFRPSSETERHQLALRYKTENLDKPLVSAYLRFSPSFFANRIKITPETGPAGSCPPGEIAKARALFRRYYGGSFTIDNPIAGARLSVLPQSDQAVFEFGTDSRSGFGYGYSPFSEEEIHFWSRSPDQLLCLYSPDIREGNERRMFLTMGEKVDILRCDIDLDFQPDRRFLSALARIRLEAASPGVDNLRFDFHSALDVLKVYDASRRELFFTQDKVNRLLYIRFLQPLEKGESASLDIYYRGALPPPPPTSDAAAAYGGFAGANFIDDGDLYTPSAGWYPAMSEGDYFLSRFRISLPPRYVCVANGELAGVEEVDEVRRVLSLEKIGNRISVFETRKPVKGLAFIVGRFREDAVDEDPSPPPINVLVSENVRSLRGTLAGEARAIVRFYEETFGPFPYEKLAIIQRVAETAGGQSPASFVILNEPRTGATAPGIPDFGSPVDLPGYRELFLAHEIAHQWWGHAVSAATYHDLWLSEGLSQYAAIRYLRMKHGNDKLPSILKKSVSWTKRMADYGPITLGARLSYLDFRAFQAIIYGKSTVVLFLLADLIGEEALDRGLRAFQASSAYRPVRTGEFIRALEEASGRSLRDFFRGWIDSHVLPEASVTHQILKADEGYEVKIFVRQAGQAMVFPLTVAWTEDGRPVRHILEVDSESKFYSFPAAVKPVKFKINPDGLVPGKFR
ncbi:MAG TPA: M1 family aminopeptidase [Candidatus Aminicenantes bacterium]|nr:M1 family aminopeptidase [Candidatus Aminicenantes bacterium]